MKNKNTLPPLVSIACITYNHSQFIKQCLESILMQKINFTFEIVIHDDASTDGTREIIEDYATRYPDIIFPMYQTENQFSKGVRGINPRFNYNRCRGNYIALCDGDDYWTDENKLQKQIDFLQANHEYSMCCHDALVKPYYGKDFIYNDYKSDLDFEFERLIYQNRIPTASIVYRKFYIDPKFFNGIMAGDWLLILLNAERGKIRYFNNVMSVYRVHTNSIWSNMEPNEMVLKGVTVMDKLNRHFKYKYDSIFKDAIRKRMEKYSYSKNKKGYLWNMRKKIIFQIKRKLTF
ncbi:MAG: glycosyltransferase [Bacteroidetes bacterium]|nr:glycosyltransferase [Bacteroidota bacterium]